MRLGVVLKMAKWTLTNTAVFIDSLKQFTCLWKVTSEDFKNRNSRQIALQNLQGIMEDIVENITIVDLKKKIDTIRSQYRKENQLVENSKKSNGYNPIYYINYQYIDSGKGISETVEALYYNTNP